MSRCLRVGGLGSKMGICGLGADISTGMGRSCDTFRFAHVRLRRRRYDRHVEIGQDAWMLLRLEPTGKAMNVRTLSHVMVIFSVRGCQVQRK